MVRKDENMNSKYVVGGRMFFEASISGDSYMSFVTNGFLDQEGYVEPQNTSRKMTKALKTIIPVSIVVLLLVIFLISKYVSK